MEKGKNGQQVAQENVKKFDEYLTGLEARKEHLPLKRNGTINVSKVAEDAKLKRRVLGQNPLVKEMYQKAVEATYAAVADTPAKKPQHNPTSNQAVLGENVKKLLEEKDRTIRTLEKKNGELAAANEELHDEIASLKTQLAAARASSLAEELLVTSGRTILPV